MKRKYFAFFMVVVLMCLFVSPVFAAGEYPRGLLYGKIFSGNVMNPERFTDGMGYGGYLRGNGRASYTFEKPVNLTSMYIHSHSYVTVTFYNGKKSIGSFSKTVESSETVRINYQYVTSIELSTTYSYDRVIFGFEVYGGESPPPAPASNVSDLVAKTLDMNRVALSWTNPSDSIFDGVQIFRDSVLVQTLSKSYSSYIVGSLEPGKTYTFRVVSLATSGIPSSGSIVKATTEGPPPIPEVPFGMRVVALRHSIDISSPSNSSDDVKGYYYYLDGKKVNNSPSKSSVYHVSNLEPSTLYRVQLSAVNKFDMESDLSDPIFVTTKPLMFKPTGLVLSPSRYFIDAIWNATNEPDVAGYNIYRYVNGNYIKITNSPVTATNFRFLNLQMNSSYSYAVSVVDLEGYESDKSDISTVMTKPRILPPTGLRATPSSYSVTLNWNQLDDSDLSGYRVYRDSILVSPIVTRVNSFTVDSLKPQTEYSFTVQSVDSRGNLSDMSFPVSVETLEPPTNVPPDPPTGLKVKPLSGGLAVSFNHNKEPDVKGYNVYVDDRKVNPVPFASNSTVVSSLKNGVSYEVHVTAVNVAELESLPSEKVSGVPIASAPPPVALGYDLKDVADGSSNMLSSLWYILAFAISVVLAFMISRFVKDFTVGG